MAISKTQLRELLYQALETEIGGVAVYRTAVTCAVNPDLKQEWIKYLDETQNHERILRGVFETLGFDPDEEVPGRKVVRHIGQSLVEAISDEVAELDGFIQNLLNATRVTAGGVSPRLEWADPRDIVNAAVKRRARRLTAHKIAVAFSDELPFIKK